MFPNSGKPFQLPDGGTEPVPPQEDPLCLRLQGIDELPQQLFEFPVLHAFGVGDALGQLVQQHRHG